MMAFVCVGLLFLVQLVIYSCKEEIVGVFTSDKDVFDKTNGTVFIIVLAFIADMIQGSIQGVIRALDV